MFPDGTLAGSVDENARRRFESAWREGRPAPIEQFLPPPDDRRFLATLEELVAIEMEFLGKARQADPADTNSAAAPTGLVEAYLERFPQLNQPSIVQRLREECAVWQRTTAGLPADEVRTLKQNVEETVANLERPSGKWPTIAGYEILGLLGRGFQGVVYKARQIQLNRIVALKMIVGDSGANPEDLARFHREAEAVAHLQHPHIVQIYDIGAQDGHSYFSMEFVAGGTLAQKLAHTPQPGSQAAEMVETLARAVHFAHQRGIVHRDLKPGNILLQQATAPVGPTPDAARPASPVVPKIADFGLAKRLEGDTTLTQSGVIMGTPSYMAPEQASGKVREIGPAADVYALGAILYEMLTGRPPFRAETPLDTVLQVVAEEPVPPSRLQPKTAGDMETICLKCLRKEPRKRYTSAEALADDLRRFQNGEPVHARPVGVLERSRRWCRRKPALALAIGLAALAALSLLGLSLAFAIHNANVAARIRHEQRQTQTVSARLALDVGQTHGEQGDVGRGMLWLGRSLTLAEQGKNPDLQRVSRVSLAAWHQKLHRLRACFEHDAEVLTVAVSPDGATILAGGEDGTARLWKVGAEKPLAPVFRHQGAVLSVAFSPDGKSIVTGGADATAQVWDAATGEPIGPRLHHPGPVNAAAFSPSDGGVVLTGSADGFARLWKTATGEQTKPTLSHGHVISTVAFSPDGQTILTGGADFTVRLWQTATGEAIGEPIKHRGWVFAAAFSPDSRVVMTGCEDRCAHFWDVATGKAIGKPLIHQDFVKAVAFSPDGKTVLTGSADSTARLWNAITCQSIGQPLRHRGPVQAVAFSSKERTILTGSHDHCVRLWETVPEQPKGPVFQHTGEVWGVAFRPPDGRTILTGAMDGKAQLWKWDETGSQRIGKAFEYKGSVQAVAFSPDGRSFAIGNWDVTDHYKVRIFDSENLKLLGSPLEHKHWVRMVQFDKEGKTIFTATGDRKGGTAQLRDAQTGEPLVQLPQTSTVWAAALSPDGKTALVGSGKNMAQFWDLTTGQPIGAPLAHSSRVVAVAFSPDGESVLTGSTDSTIRIWSAPTGKPLGEPFQHPEAVWATAFSPDGKTILTGGNDRNARLWDAATGKPIGPALRHGGTVWAVAFSPDGRFFLTGSEDRTARLWETPAALEGESERIVVWTQVVTGMQLKADAVDVLDAPGWLERRRRLEALGGPPGP
jgi:eukaryotic-like serine/threonine-protein kinase